MLECITMKKTTVRDLRYHSPEIEALLSKGEEMSEDYPDFSSLRRQIFGTRGSAQPGPILPLRSGGAIDRLRGHRFLGVVLWAGQQ